MTKTKAALVGLLASTAAVAYVPPGYQQQGSGVLPSVRPVRGPIRPNLASTGKGSGSGKPLILLQGPHYDTYLTQPIFWGKEWSNPRFGQDKIEGMDRWYAGYDESNYARALYLYTGLKGGLDYQGYLVDGSSGPERATPERDVSRALREVCGLIDKHQLTYARGGGNFYPIYLYKKRPAGGACAINATDICGSLARPVSLVLIYNLDGDAVCDPQDHETGHSQGLASIANVTARAVADLMTDWDFEGFFDSSGNEVDDKCAWTFNAPYVTFTNGSQWKLQGLWSNLAYWTGTGYPNADGDKGCVDGH